MERLSKYDIVLMDLEPTRGAEKRGLRPCLILQSNRFNLSAIQTVAVAPITSHLRDYIPLLTINASKENGLKKDSCVDLSQIRTMDKSRYRGTLGHLESQYHKTVMEKVSIVLDIGDQYK